MEHRWYRVESRGGEGALHFKLGIIRSTCSLRFYQVSTAANFPRTAQDCAIRWLGDRHPQFVHTAWTASEIEKLQTLVENAPERPLDWVEIANKLGVRLYVGFRLSTRLILRGDLDESHAVGLHAPRFTETTSCLETRIGRCASNRYQHLWGR